MSEISQILSQFLYYQGLLAEIHSINQEVQDPRIPEEQVLNNMCASLASIFLSYGASIWVRHHNIENRYVCRGQHNCPEIGHQITRDPESVWFETTDVNSVSAKVVNGSKHWVQEHLGVERMSSLWQQSLPELSRVAASPIVDHITVVRITTPGALFPIATLSLYNISVETTELTGFDEKWDGLVQFVSSDVAMLIESMRDRSEEERTQRRYIEHEIRQRVGLISNRANKLVELSKRGHSVSSVSSDRRFALALDDLRIYAGDVSGIVNMLAQKQFTAALRSGENPVIMRAEQLRNKGRVDAILLKEVFRRSESLFYDTDDTQTKISRSLKIEWEQSPDVDALRIEIHEANLRVILDNLLGNALKYASGGATVVAKFQKLANGAAFSISNPAPCLEPGERYRLGKDGFWGEWAKKHVSEGQGKGLFFVRTICELYGIEFSYKMGRQDHMCLHIPTLIFPDAILRPPYHHIYGR